MRDRPRDPRDSDALSHGKGRCAAGAAARGASTFRGVGCQPDKHGCNHVIDNTALRIDGATDGNDIDVRVRLPVKLPGIIVRTKTLWVLICRQGLMIRIY